MVVQGIPAQRTTRAAVVEWTCDQLDRPKAVLLLDKFMGKVPCLSIRPSDDSQPVLQSLNLRREVTVARRQCLDRSSAFKRFYRRPGRCRCSEAQLLDRIELVTNLQQPQHRSLGRQLRRAQN